MENQEQRTTRRDVADYTDQMLGLVERINTLSMQLDNIRDQAIRNLRASVNPRNRGDFDNQANLLYQAWERLKHDTVMALEANLRAQLASIMPELDINDPDAEDEGDSDEVTDAFGFTQMRM